MSLTPVWNADQPTKLFALDGSGASSTTPLLVGQGAMVACNLSATANIPTAGLADPPGTRYAVESFPTNASGAGGKLSQTFQGLKRRKPVYPRGVLKSS